MRDLSPIAAAQPVRRRDAELDPQTLGELPYSDLPVEREGTRRRVTTKGATSVWEDSSFVPVLADETTRLIPTRSMDNDSMSGSDAVLSQSRADLERARLASSREGSRREPLASATDRYILGCSVLLATSVVFVVFVSGLTTILTNRSIPHLEVYSDWPNGGIIPLKYGCLAPDGNPISIPLHWRNVPQKATNLVILFANPGAITEQDYDPVHWFITDIPLNDGSPERIRANVSANPQLMPAGAKVHANSGNKDGSYWPPCVVNSTSFFVVHIYAIDASPQIEDFKDAREIMNRFVGVPVARITGTYGKPSPLVISDANNDDNEQHDQSRGVISGSFSESETEKIPHPREDNVEADAVMPELGEERRFVVNKRLDIDSNQANL